MSGSVNEKDYAIRMLCYVRICEREGLCYKDVVLCQDL